jgi:acyl-CoA synthetase (AMP-forming)/AMP-acid ligase II/pimeloyl-ACP methyl ester carboxylesterase
VTSGEPALPPAGLPGLDRRWSRSIDVPGGAGGQHRWHLLDNGAAATAGTLLCVHGNPTWSYLWRRLVAAAPPGWRVLAPDQLGMGYSERLDNPRSLSDRVSDLGDLTTALGVTGPVVVVAHDWGGPVALGWAMAHRSQLQGIVLTNTAVRQPESFAAPALIRLARQPGLRQLSCVRTPMFVRTAGALSRPRLARDVRDALAAPYGTSARRRAVGDFVADIPLSPQHPSAPPLARIADGLSTLDVPLLVLWGPRDPVFTERHLADLLQRRPDAQLHRYEGANHLVTEDAPQYAEAVARWVGDLSAAPARGAQPPAASRPALWAALSARAKDRSAAVREVAGATVGWDLLARRVDEVAAGLAASGVRAGDRVALLVPPSADLTAAVYAVWRAGAVMVVADKGLGALRMARALRSARVDHVIGTAAGLALARLAKVPGTRIAAGPVTPTTMRALGARRRLVDLARIGRSSPLPPEPGPDDECAVVFTSGATGPPKGVVYRHRQLQAQLELVRSTYALTGDDRFVAAFAPFALLGPGLGIASSVPDIDVTAPATLTAGLLADAVSAVGATVVFASPAALRGVHATAGDLTPPQRASLGGVRLLISAGAPVPASLLRGLRAVLPAAEAHTPYGMTEAMPVTDISLAQIEAAGAGDGVCVGRPLAGVEVAVSAVSSLGTADAAPAPDPGVTGEVCVRAAHVKDHYDALWATERDSSRDPGWHRTGDVGHLDGEGRLWIEGRLGHVVTTAAGVVTPVGPEQRVQSLPAVAAAAVVGVGPVGIQQVVVVVVPEGPAPSPRSPVAGLGLTDAVRAVAGVEVAAVLLAAALPVDIRHASKVDRRRLAEWATAVLEGGDGRKSPT